ncbi:MAG: hemerythrin domain-containing protein [Deltaproteobacteria bacterium]|nr:hemerythrin domain-containing protein [Deltaproteobacteria bacterium]
MMPIGPLMIEHRRIEKMIDVIRKELVRIEERKVVATTKIDVFVDFIRTYTDRCHHGKEEDILFRDVAKKDITGYLRRTMEELISEHQWARNVTVQLVAANRSYAEGDNGTIEKITNCLRSLVDFYPVHILKEDRRFFIPVMDYFSPEEKDALLKEGYTFDQKLIHEKYEEIINRFL